MTLPKMLFIMVTSEVPEQNQLLSEGRLMVNEGVLNGGLSDRTQNSLFLLLIARAYPVVLQERGAKKRH